MRAANLTYNGIRLALVRTNSIVGVPVFSDDGIDYLYTKFTINIDAILNPNETSYSLGPPPIESEDDLPNETYVAIRHMMMQPRGKLLFTNFGLNVFASPEEGATVDANHGPFPQAFTVTRIDGAKLWHVNYVIDTYIANCPFGNQHAILSNRFGQTHNIDRDFYTYITTRGYAQFRTDVLTQQGTVADAFRSQLLPPIPPQFRRETMEFGINTKGNMIEYTIVDREVKLDLGDTGATGSATFITDMKGYYNLSTISAAPPGGGEAIPTGMSMATMNVQLTGSRQASNWELVQLAFQSMIGSGKIKLGLDKSGRSGIVHHFSVTQLLESNFVEVTLSVKQTASKNGPFGGMNIDGLKVDNIVPDYKGMCPTPPNDNMTRGDASILLISSLTDELKQACVEPTKPLAATGGGGMSPPDYQGPPPAITVYPTDRLPKPPNRYNQSQVESPYAEYKIDSYYEANKGRWHVPSSGKRQRSTSSGGGEEPPADDDEPTSSVIDLYLPMTKRVVLWQAERYGEKPKIPAFELNSTKLKLLDYNIHMCEVILMEDGVTPCYRVSGKYVYAAARELADFTDVAFDIPQFIDYPYGQETLKMPARGAKQGGDFQQGIIGA